MKKYSRGKKRYGNYKRRKPKTKGARMGRSMQKKSYSYVKKKYTLVRTIDIAAGSDVRETTISHIGGPNVTEPAGTFTLANVNPDNMASVDMRAYQYFKITGVAFKIFFPEGTTPEATPV